MKIFNILLATIILIIGVVSTGSCIATSLAATSPEQAKPLPPPPVMIISLNGGIDDETAKAVSDSIQDAQSSQAIVFEINSGGGSVEAGFAISKSIERSETPIICVVDGEADSMAFYVLQSCKIRFMTKRSILMIHMPSLSGRVNGNMNDFADYTDSLTAMTKAMCEHVARRMKMQPEDLYARIKIRAWWMEWKEAVEFGAVNMAVDSVDDVVQTELLIIKKKEESQH